MCYLSATYGFGLNFECLHTCMEEILNMSGRNKSHLIAQLVPVPRNFGFLKLTLVPRTI